MSQLTNHLGSLDSDNEKNIDEGVSDSESWLIVQSGVIATGLSQDPIYIQLKNLELGDWSNSHKDEMYNDKKVWFSWFAQHMVKSFDTMVFWNGKHPILQELWMRYQYAFKDSDNMYFFFLWSKFYDFRSIVSELGWNVVEITNQKDILKNWLYADKIIYLKLQHYKNKTLLIVLHQWSEKRLIIVPHRLYYKKKQFISEQFEKIYRK